MDCNARTQGKLVVDETQMKDTGELQCCKKAWINHCVMEQTILAYWLGCGDVATATQTTLAC